MAIGSRESSSGDARRSQICADTQKLGAQVAVAKWRVAPIRAPCTVGCARSSPAKADAKEMLPVSQRKAEARSIPK